MERFEAWEIIFWNKYNEAHLFGSVSVLEFETEDEANNFAEHANVKDCVEVSFAHRVGNAVIESYSRMIA